MTFALIILGSIYFFYTDSKTELAPQEDQGVLITAATSAPNSTLAQRLLYDRQVYQDFAGYPGNRACVPARRARARTSPAWC